MAQQSVLSTIRGTAKDQSVASVPNVAVTVVDVNMGVSRSTTTNSSGDYEVPNLLRGTYRLRAVAAGFSTFVADNIILESTQQRRVDIQFQGGTTQTQVTVKANAAVIETESGQVSSSANYIATYENPMTLSQLYPSEIELTAPGVYNSRGGRAAAVNGNTGFGLSQCSDGACENTIVTQDNDVNNVAEIKTMLSNSPAEYARPVHIDLVYKSGWRTTIESDRVANVKRVRSA